MSWRNAPLAAALTLLLPLPAFAGGMAVTSARPTTPHPTVVAPTPVRAVGYTAQREATAPVVITVAVTPAPQPAVEPVFVDLRGPDGQLRRFPVVGGRDAIQSPTIVLHPGQSVNIQWVAAK